MSNPSIRLGRDAKTVTVAKLVSHDSLLFELLDDTPVGERAEMLNSVLHIGALAMLEDRVHHLISATEREIFPKLEGFKRLFERKKMEFEKTTQKGEQAEVDIVQTLNEYIQGNGWSDLAQASGTLKGALPRNKTGDVLCVLELNPETSEGAAQLAIEVKFDKAVALGDPMVQDIMKGSSSTSGGLKKSSFDTAWSQLLETRANRECPFSLMVFDKRIAHKTVRERVQDVAFLPGVPGFLVMVDSQAGDYRNLFVAYHIARDLALYAPRERETIDAGVLELLVGRIIQYLGSAQKVRDLVDKNTKETLKMTREVHKEMGRLVHLATFTQEYLKKFLVDKTLTARDLTEFYYAADAKAAWKQDNDHLEAMLEEWA